MNRTDTRDVLYQVFGTSTPFWTVSADRREIRFCDISGAIAQRAGIDADDLARIRILGETPSKLNVRLSIRGENVWVCLVGLRVDECTWKGFASTPADDAPKTEPVGVSGGGEGNVIPLRSRQKRQNRGRPE